MRGGKPGHFFLEARGMSLHGFLGDVFPKFGEVGHRLVPFLVLFPKRLETVKGSTNCLTYAVRAMLRATFYHEGVAAAFPTAAGLLYLLDRVRSEHDDEVTSAPGSARPAQQFRPRGL